MTFFVHDSQTLKQRRPLGMAGLAVLLAALSAFSVAAAEPLVLRIGDHRLRVEVASTPEQRARGLMGRPPLGADEGMLFVFPGDEARCLWMRDTPSALAAAFISAQGDILNVVEMRPLSDTHHCSRAPARYALEATTGWFSTRGIHPGERIQGLGAVAPVPR
jgi:uncharacterized membrane protein (UPF0127 family)